MEQFVIGQHQRHHRFDHGRAANAHARVVTALGANLRRLSIARHAVDRGQDRTGRLEGDAAQHRLAGRNAARDAPCVIGEEFGAALGGPHRIGILLARQARGGESVTDLHALDRVDPHHAGGEVGVELGIERRAPACGHTRRHAFDHRAER